MEHVAFILAIVDNRVVGSIIAAFDGWRGNLYRLATHPDHRRRGMARALVGEAEEAFDGWGVRRITALVEKDHPWAVQFWQAVGYALDERMSRYVRNVPQSRDGIKSR
jgi:GNAT superfamily N-acetyltransferase